MQHNRLLEGKNVIITGAASGIGLATVKTFAENGANIWAFVHKCSEQLEDTFSEISKENCIWIKMVCADLTDESSLKAAFTQVKSEHSQVDVLVNNAGASYDALLPMISTSKMKDLFDINLYAQIQLTQYVSRLMMRQKSGTIVFTGSYLGFDGNRGQLVYSATKGAVHAVIKSLAQELVQYNIRVNGVAPGVIETKLISTMTEEEYKNSIEKNYMKRSGKPEEVAKMILVLASDLSSYVTGQIIRVDGGM